MEYVITLKTFIIVCPLIFIGGFVDSIAGGGGLITLPAYMIAGMPPINASATSKLSAVFANIVSFLKYFKKGFIDFKYAKMYMLAGFVGSILGTYLLNLINQEILKILIMIMLPIVFIITSNKKIFINNNDTIKFSKKQTFIICLIISFLLGIYDGFYGPGTGTFLFIFYYKIGRLNINEANGIAKSINLCTGVGSVIVHLMSGKMIYAVGLVAAIFAIFGSYVGSTLFIKKGVNIARPIILIVIIIFFIKLLLEYMHII